MKKRCSRFPKVHFSEDGPLRHLHLGTPWIQGSMHLRHPNRLVHEYIQRMMAWLLFVQPESLSERCAMQLGLGAGSLTKFCVQELRMRTIAIEINPQVVQACQGWFHLPLAHTLLQVVLADAMEEIQNPQWWGSVDALQVDLYDHDASAPVVDHPRFYEHCHRLLSDGGCMTVNVFGRMSNSQRTLADIADIFGSPGVWAFNPTHEGNTVIVARKTPPRSERHILEARAEWIENHWRLPARKWVRACMA